MKLLTTCLTVFLSSMYVLPVVSEGFKCENTNYRLFLAHSGPSNPWTGSKDEAEKMCAINGHVLARNLECAKKMFREKPPIEGDAKRFWLIVNDTTDDKCQAFVPANAQIVFMTCSERAYALCQGLSSLDHQLGVAYKDGPFPYTQIFGQSTSSPENLPAIDAYYVLCSILGIILISIVVAAAIWRSGYINNRYSFRRMPANAGATQRPAAPKSRTVTSGLDSEVPHGYVKASVTKETLA